MEKNSLAQRLASKLWPASSEARATFTALTTAAKKAGQERPVEKKRNLPGVSTRYWNYRVDRHVTFVNKESTAEASGASEESPKRPANMLLLVWHGVVIGRKEKLRRQAIVNDLKGQKASKQTHEVPLLS